MPPEDDVDLEERDDRESRGRAFWSGTITFGLVSVPVELYPASRSRRVSLRMLSPKGVPLRRHYYDAGTDRELDSDDIVRGYEVEKEEFVLVTDEELERLEPRKSRDIDLRRFVPAADIDPIYFERAYFLAPAGGSTKAYRLLAATMEKTDRAGIATFVMRGKEYLIAILAENGILRAETLRFADEIRSAEDVGLPEPAKPKAGRVSAIRKAMKELEEPELDEEELEDPYARRLFALVERKRKAGEDLVEAPDAEPEAEAEVIDLMEILKQRMGAAGSDRRAPKRAGADGRTSSAGRKAAGGAPKAAETDLEDLTKDELYERAQALDIPGRSSMSKKELVRAIRSA